MPKKIELVLEGQEGHEQDIISYLDSELEIGDSKLAHEVRAQIQEKASGVFMWVVLVAGILQQKYDQGRIHTLKQTLREIPGDLHELFRDILTRDDANKDELLLCIQWVLFARNPLKPEQLYFAIRSHAECTTCKWDRGEIGEVAIGNFILSSSKGLAEVTRVKKDPTVQFIHESVRDFLLKDGGLRVILETSEDISAVCHDQLKRCCYRYTQSYTEENGLPESDTKHHLAETRDAADIKFPFLRYAVQNVIYHANAAGEGHISQTKFLETFQLETWIQHNNVFQDKDVRRHTTGASLLYLLAEYNFGSLIDSHRGSQSCFDIEGERYGAPILAAMATGSQLTVWRLLKRETREEPATSHLHSLCSDYDVERKVKHKIGRSFKFKPQLGLLYYLLHEDDLIAASVAIASSKPYTYINIPAVRETLFSVAIMCSYDVCSTFRFLIENGADIEAVNMGWLTPLCLAAGKGSVAAVALLLEKGANVEHTRFRGRKPLMYAAASGSEECIQMLISGGANVAAIDHYGCTALVWLLRQQGVTETKVKMLLSHDTADIPEFKGTTPLMLSVKHSLSIMKQLLNRGVDINWIDDRGQSALLLAVKLKAKGQARLLIDSGAYPDIFDTNNHRTALSYAVSSQYHDITFAPQGHLDMESAYHGGYLPSSIAEALLIRGAAVDKHDIKGRTPLSYAAYNGGSAELISLLLSYGANVHHADDSGRTPLSYAASSHEPDAKNCLRLLLDAGAIPDKIDKAGKTALSYATTDEIRDLLSNYP
ncbi:hypothetical protein FNYG_07933 [Fusarium nygamai]|uniref:Uncharacterized protein n=1 Tax=Gibberella nygamai TaxID=42673 RepID=A0A2K0W981_GIBNY|nr:hypothetical protein FNYG_07933 [Fusarium nygamai]